MKEERTHIEVLTRLNPPSVDLLPMPPGYGSLTMADISHALSFVKPKGAALLGRVMIAQQEFLPELKHELVLYLKIEALRLKWRNIGPLPRLAESAISGYIKPRRCWKCKNVRMVIIRSRKITCPVCEGQPVLPVFNTEVAEELGVSDRQYYDTWKIRFGCAWDHLLWWHERCSDDLKNALKMGRHKPLTNPHDSNMIFPRMR